MYTLPVFTFFFAQGRFFLLLEYTYCIIVSLVGIRRKQNRESNEIKKIKIEFLDTEEELAEC